VGGRLAVAVRDFCLGPGRNALEPDEIIMSIRVPVTAGYEQFAKLGPRNSMVIAVASVAVRLDPGRRSVGAAIGSAAPTPVPAVAAEQVAAAELDWSGRGERPARVASRFAARAVGARAPVD